MSPAERLRAAATRLREVAADATTGPWSVTREHLTHPEAGADVRGAGGRWVASDCDGYQGGCLPADADYIAMMHPPVALALADWLDSEAAVQGSMEPMANLISLTIEKAGGPAGYVRIGTDEDGNPQMQADSSPAALAVADAVLGSES